MTHPLLLFPLIPYTQTHMHTDIHTHRHMHACPPHMHACLHTHTHTHIHTQILFLEDLQDFLIAYFKPPNHSMRMFQTLWSVLVVQKLVKHD